MISPDAAVHPTAHLSDWDEAILPLDTILQIDSPGGTTSKYDALVIYLALSSVWLFL